MSSFTEKTFPKIRKKLKYTIGLLAAASLISAIPVTNAIGDEAKADAEQTVRIG